jgi:outer membrane protein OmpA-like peptidoglycan-associated protein
MRRISLGLSALLPLLTSSFAFAQSQPAPAASGGASMSLGGTANNVAPMPANGALSEDAQKAQEAAEWAERDQNAGETTTKEGSVGLLHTRHAQGGSPGQFRLQFMTQYFSDGFLCSAENPCPDPQGGAARTSHSLDQIGGQLALGVTVLKWLEVYASTSAYATSTDANRPGLLQVLGDSMLGAKGFTKLGKVFWLGGSFDLMLVNGTGAVGLSGAGTSARFQGLATVDLRGLDKKVPARFSFNAAYTLDNSGEVVRGDEERRQAPITRIERFGLRVNRVDHFDLRLGGETFLLENRVRPFAEVGVDIPVNRQGYECRLQNPSGDRCLANDGIAPSRLTLGARVLPWKKGVSFTAAFDIGLVGTNTFIEEVAPTPPWTLYLGAGWAIDTKERPPVEKIKTIEKVVEVHKPKGKISGFVHESGGGQAAVPGAIVAWSNHPELTAMVAGADGRFATLELEPGDYTFSVKADGYKPGECAAKVSDAATAQVDCAVEALPRVGVVVGHVKDEQGNPVAGASIKLKEGNGKELQLITDAQGAFRFVDLSPGTAALGIDAPEFLATTASVEVKVRQESNLDVVMHHRPKNAQVTVEKSEIRIKQQVQFETNQAVILPVSTPLLEEIADVFIKNPRIKRVEVQGHTDNTGGTERNRTLSDERANAVRNWLIAHGVGPDRLVAKGYGESKPLVPNVTAGNKARNRRVQFVIQEQDPATDEPKKKDAKAADTKAPETKAPADTKAPATPKKKVDVQLPKP